ncbi:hypothetical protein ACJZ2D_011516 [Fusarium nematophilum]
MATFTGAPPDPLPPDENVGPVLLGVSGTLIVLVVTTTSLRIWVRCALRSLKWDDYTIVIAALLGIARFAIQVVQVGVGNGRHIWYISKEDYMTNTMLGLIAIMLLFASMCFLKISILLLLLRLEGSRRLRYSIWAIIAGLVITNFGCNIIFLAECDRFEAYWTGVGKCWDVRVRIYAIYFTIGNILHPHRHFVLATPDSCPTESRASLENEDLSVGPDEPRSSVGPMLRRLQTLFIDMMVSATGFGIARAASLGITTADLSCEWQPLVSAPYNTDRPSPSGLYAITAIWSNLELYLGITAAKLALSRSMYAHFFGAITAKKPSTDPESGSNSTCVNNRFRTTRPPSPTRSNNSAIPLGPAIQKRTDIWVREERANHGNNHNVPGAIDAARVDVELRLNRPSKDA